MPIPPPPSPVDHHHLPLRLRPKLIKPRTTFLSKNARREVDETGKGAEAARSEREGRRVMLLPFPVESGGLRAMEK